MSKSKRQKKKQQLWIIIGLILVIGLGYAGKVGYDKYKVHKFQMAVERKIEQYREQVKENPEDVELLMKYGIFLHDFDTLERLEKAEEIFLKVQELSPNNPMAIGYYGSTLTKKANHLESIPDKVEALQAGLDIMDKTVSDYPDSFDARMVRAENNFYIPEMFNRIDISVKDFEHLLVLAKREYESMIPYVKYRLGQSYLKAKRPEDAKQVLQELIDEYPNHNYAPRAKEILKSIN